MEATMVSQLLSQLDGHMQKTPGLVVIGATNNIDEIEPSIYRAGRLKTVPFDELDEEGMLFILKELAKDAGLPESFDYQTVAEMLSGETASMAAQKIFFRRWLRKKLVLKPIKFSLLEKRKWL